MSETKPPDPGQAIQKAEGPTRAAVTVGRQGVMLNNLAELMAFAKLCTDGGIGPRGMSQASAAIAIQAGLERGMGPIGGLQAAVVINGVLSWRGSACVGLIQNSPVIVPGTWTSGVENPGTEQAVGWCRAQRRGYDKPFLRTFSVTDAKKAGLWKKGGPWDTRPDNMLEWRAIGDMGRFHFWDVLGNLPIAEDVEAGGIGPAEGPKELAVERPAPRAPLRDPILAELAPGSVPQEQFVEATLVADPSVPADELHFINKDGSVAGKIVGLAEPQNVSYGEMPTGFGAVTPSQQAVIDAQVDEMFPPPPVKATQGLELLSSKQAKPKQAKAIDPGGPCPRCTAPRNAMNGCDVCGWPGADNGERP